MASHCGVYPVDVPPQSSTIARCTNLWPCCRAYPVFIPPYSPLLNPCFPNFLSDVVFHNQTILFTIVLHQCRLQRYGWSGGHILKAPHFPPNRNPVGGTRSVLPCLIYDARSKMGAYDLLRGCVGRDTQRQRLRDREIERLNRTGRTTERQHTQRERERERRINVHAC